MRLRALVGTLGVVVAASAIEAAADTSLSVTTANVNLRSGAGANHARIATLPVGTQVMVDRCRQGWCLVESIGLSGWLSARYLIRIESLPSVNRPVVRAPPVATFDFVVPRAHDFHDLGYSRQHGPNRDLHGMRR